MRFFQLVEDAAELDGLHFDIELLLNVGPDGNQVVFSFYLHAVPGEIEQADRAAIETLSELADGAEHVFLRQILSGDHIESDISQCCGHPPRVIHRIGQRSVSISAVSDHQRHSRFRGPLCHGTLCGLPAVLNRSAENHRRHQENAYQDYIVMPSVSFFHLTVSMIKLAACQWADLSAAG